MLKPFHVLNITVKMTGLPSQFDYMRELPAYRPIRHCCHLAKEIMYLNWYCNRLPFILIHLLSPSVNADKVASYITTNRKVNHKMRPATKNSDGKRCELLAANWLFSQGCFVYAPFLEQGPVDLIAINPDGETLYFDVKKVARRKNGSIISRKLSDTQRKLGVKLMYVDMKNHICALFPHQIEKDTGPRSKQSEICLKHAAQKASNRHFNGEKVPTIAELVHPKSSQTNQSCPEES